MQYVYNGLRRHKVSITDQAWWEMQAKTAISFIFRIINQEDCLYSFHDISGILDCLTWIYARLPFPRTGQLPDWELLRSALEHPAIPRGVQFDVFALCWKWGSPEAFRGWWEVAAEHGSSLHPTKDFFIFARRAYMVQMPGAWTTTLDASGEKIDDTTWHRLLRNFKQQLWLTGDIKNMGMADRYSGAYDSLPWVSTHASSLGPDPPEPDVADAFLSSAMGVSGGFRACFPHFFVAFY